LTAADAHDPPPPAKKLPRGRVARTARVGGLVTGQGVRWAGPDGRVGFLDFGLVRDVDSGRVAAEAAIAVAVRDKDADALKRALVAGATCRTSARTRSTRSSP
jgi:hypothetical protein